MDDAEGYGAFNGDVSVTMDVSLLALGKRFTQTGGTLQLVLASATKGTLSVASDITLAGNLAVSLGYQPAVGDLAAVLSSSGAALHGRFTSITVDGHTVTPVYGINGLQLRFNS